MRLPRAPLQDGQLPRNTSRSLRMSALPAVLRSVEEVQTFLKLPQRALAHLQIIRGFVTSSQDMSAERLVDSIIIAYPLAGTAWPVSGRKGVLGKRIWITSAVKAFTQPYDPSTPESLAATLDGILPSPLWPDLADSFAVAPPAELGDFVRRTFAEHFPTISEDRNLQVRSAISHWAANRDDHCTHGARTRERGRLTEPVDPLAASGGRLDTESSGSDTSDHLSGDDDDDDNNDSTASKRKRPRPTTGTPRAPSACSVISRTICPITLFHDLITSILAIPTAPTRDRLTNWPDGRAVAKLAKDLGLVSVGLKPVLARGFIEQDIPGEITTNTTFTVPLASALRERRIKGPLTSISTREGAFLGSVDFLHTWRPRH